MGELGRRVVRCRAGAALAITVLIGLSACTSKPAREVSSLPTREATTTAAAPSVPARGSVATATIRAYITGYSYFDNTRPITGQISHPILHNQAGGRGTYDDPITVAVGHVREGEVHTMDWPAGTRFYVPNLRRYLIVEDTCGDGERPQDGPCHIGYPPEATTWLNVWIGGKDGTSHDAELCMQKITGVWDVLVEPSPDLAVDPGDIYSPASPLRSDPAAPGCARTYGDEVSRLS